mgnify:CR=1 FL=1
MLDTLIKLAIEAADHGTAIASLRNFIDACVPDSAITVNIRDTSIDG